MGEVTLFECDFTGEKFPARNDVFEIGVKRRWSHEPFRVHEYAIHLSDEAVEESGVYSGQFHSLQYVAIDGREIVGCGLSMKSDSYSNDRHVEYFERDDVVARSNEEAMAWLESEVIV